MTVINIHQTSHNQKCVMTHKTLSDETHLYGKSNIEATLLAARILSDRAYKLYSRMNLHQDQYGYALSPTEIRNSIGMSEKRYQQAVRELIEKGYLIQRKTRSNLYDFYEWPGDAADRDGLENDRVVSELDGMPVIPGVAVSEVGDTPVKAEMTVAESAGQPGKSGSMSQQRALGFPTTPGGEILQDTTFNTTKNTTMNTTLDSTREQEYQRKFEEDYRKYQALLAKRRKEKDYYEEYEDEYAFEIDDRNAELGDTWTWDDENLPF